MGEIVDDLEKKRIEKRREAAYKAMDGLWLLRDNDAQDAYAGVKYLILDALGKADDPSVAP